MPINQQAADLNETIRSSNPHIFAMLAEKGKNIYFPKRGILSQSADANGKEIDATIGTALEDDGAPMSLPSIAHQFTGQSTKIFGYAPSYGQPRIRAAWKETLFKKNPSLVGAQVSQPVVTCALTHGLSMAGYLFADPSDTIIMPDKYWENYDLVFTQAHGAQIHTFPMFSGAGFNVEGLRTSLSGGAPGKRIVLLNFPNNPTGYTCTVEEGLQIRDVLLESANAGNDLVVLIDDAYFGLVFEPGIMTESLFGLLANAHERILAVKLDGPTKEDYVWGFRVGFVTFGCARSSPELYTALEAKLAGAIRGNISNSSNIGQMLLLTAYANPGYEAERRAKFETLKKRYDKIKQVLAAHREYGEFFEPLPYNSGYFMCVRVKSGDAEPVRQVLLKKHNTGVIAFGDLIRIAFSATPNALIERLMVNIYQACREVAGHG